MITKKRASLVIILMFAANNINALDVNDVRNKLVSALGGEDKVLSNATNGDAWRDPSSGVTYYSGGNIFIRLKTTKGYPAFFDARGPSIKAGCDGFDLDAGYFAIIDLDGITDQLSSAGTSIVGGFLSSILYSTPILGDIIESVKKISDEITKIMQNACSIGKQIGTASTSYITDKAMQEDSSAYVASQKAKGVLKTAEDAITENADKIAQNISCMSSDDIVGCYSDNNIKDKDGYTDLISSLLETSDKGKNTNHNTLLHPGTKSSFKNIMMIDKITLKDYLSGNDSNKGYIETNPIFKNYSTEMKNIYLALSKIDEASPAICQEIEDIYKTFAQDQTDETKAKTIAKLKATLNKNNKTQSVAPKSNTISKFIDGTTFNEEKTSQVIEFLLEGKTVSITNDILYVIQKPLLASDKSNSELKTKKYTYLCKGSETFNINWSGIASTSDVEDSISKIASGEAPDSTIPIVSESAKFAKILNKKNTLYNNGVFTIASSISLQNIALLNNYILATKIIDALNDMQKDETSGNASDSNELVIDNDKTVQENLLQYKESLKNKLNNILGTEDFLKVMKEDAEKIEKEYNLFKSKKRSGR